jgi:hypothetical protein
MSKPKPPASITNAEGVILADETIRIIKQSTEVHPFTSSVHLSLIGLRARLKDGAYFTEGMERTLRNWSKAIGPGKPPGERRQ